MQRTDGAPAKTTPDQLLLYCTFRVLLPTLLALMRCTGCDLRWEIRDPRWDGAAKAVASKKLTTKNAKIIMIQRKRRCGEALSYRNTISHWDLYLSWARIARWRCITFSDISGKCFYVSLTFVSGWAWTMIDWVPDSFDEMNLHYT